MNALSKAQFEWDNRQPIDLPDNVAERVWIENSAELLIGGADVKVKRRGKPARQVSFEQFTAALDKFAMERLQHSQSASAFGLLVWAALCSPRDARGAAERLLEVPDTQRVMREIADRLLAPLSADGVIADAEDAE